MAEEIRKALLNFGLQGNESNVYLLLARTGACPVGLIARRLGSNRMGVYRNLRALEEKGLVESTVDRPSKFVAVPIVNFLNRCIEESKTKTSSLVRDKEEIVDYCEHSLKVEVPTKEPKFRIVQGRKRIFDQILKMLETAKTEACIIQTGNGLYRLIYRGIDDRLKELNDEGVQVMVLTNVEETSIEAVKNFLNFAHVRHVASPSVMRLILVDEIEALTAFSIDDSMSLTTENDLAMWIRAPDYVKSMKVFFQALWRDGVLAQHRLASINERQTLRESLNLALKMLEADGWKTMVPGKLIGESGVEHSFDLVAEHRREKNISIALDLQSGHSLPQILAFGLKVLDTKPTAKLLAARGSPDQEESEAATRSGIKLICADRSQQLAAKILDLARKILRTGKMNLETSSKKSNVSEL